MLTQPFWFRATIVPFDNGLGATLAVVFFAILAAFIIVYPVDLFHFWRIF